MTEPCPHCRRLREERDEALEGLRQARAAAELDFDLAHYQALKARFALTPAAAKMLLALVSVTRALGAVDLLAAAGSESAVSDVGLARSHVAILRRRLAAVDPELAIETIERVGWRLTPLARAKLKRALAAVHAERGP